MYLIILLWFIVAVIEGQRFNLGTLNLGRNPSGDLELDFGQGGQFLGFGGDRSLGLLIGPGRLGAKCKFNKLYCSLIHMHMYVYHCTILADGGLLLGGQRLGIDSNFGYQEGRGLNLGSLLQVDKNMTEYTTGIC